MKVELTYTEKNEIYYVNSHLPERTRANARKIECIFCTKRGLTDTRNCANLSYSSLAQSVERMTVNHDVAGSSPAGGATRKPL